MALEAEFDRGGVHRLAVLKLDALAQLHDEALVVVDPLPLGRELRHDVELGADVDELVAERGEDDAADIGARQGRVEDVGVFGEPDPQRRLRRSRAGAEAPRSAAPPPKCVCIIQSSQFIVGSYAQATPSAPPVKPL